MLPSSFIEWYVNINYTHSSPQLFVNYENLKRINGNVFTVGVVILKC